jgi:hypothetical protein
VSKLVNLRFDGGGTLTFVEDRVRRTVQAGEAFAVKPDLARILLADPAVVDLQAAEAAAEAHAAAAVEGSGYEAMSVPQLRELAKKRDLDVPSKANKAELVAAHVAADEGPDDEPASTEPSPAADAAPEPASTGGAVTLGDLPDGAKVKD